MLKIKLLNKYGKCPTRQTAGSAGYDIYAADTTIVPARSKQIISTGISIQLPTCPLDGHIYCLKIVSRSGLSAKNSLEKGAGLIDADYTGELKIILYNHSDKDYQVNMGDRIAQGIIIMVAIPNVIQVDELNDTDRGGDGFGSTGV